MRRIYSNLKNQEAVSVYYVGTFLTDFAMSLTFSIYAIFLLRSGLDLFQIMIVNSTYMISVFILEVPTGAFADALGRKKSVLISALLMMIGLAFYPIFRNFYTFLIAEFLIAISSSFASGAFDAWMVDTSKKQGFEGKVDFVFSQANVVSRLAFILGGLIGAYIAIANIGMPFFIGAGVALVSYFFFLYTMEQDVSRKFSLIAGFRKAKVIAKESIKYSLGHKVIFWLIIGGFLAVFVFQPMNMYWGPRFNAMGGDRIWLTGWFWAFNAVFMMLGAYLVRVFLGRGKHYTFLMIMAILLISVPIILSASSNILLVAFPAYLIHEIARGIHRPVQQAYLNKYSEPEKRATIFSFESMTSALGAAVGLWFFGWVAKNTSIETSWIMAGIFALVLIPIYLMARKKEKHYA